MTQVKEPIPFTMWQSALMIALQSFLFGYFFSCLNSCLVTGDNNSGSDCYHGKDSSCPTGTIYNDINLSTLEAQIATSLTVLGAWIGCLIGSKPSEMKGRKFTLLANNAFFIGGAILACCGNVYALFIGRFITGLGVGVASVVPAVLLSEIASPNNRGIITTLHQLLITLAIFIASIIGYGLVTYVNHGWQYVQALGAIPSLAMLIFHSLIPESPKWLLSQQINASSGKNLEESSNLMHVASESGPQGNYSKLYPEVYRVLQSLRPSGYDVDSEITSMLDDMKQNQLNQSSEVAWSEVFQSKQAMVIGCGLMLFQAITGINSVVFYSTTIFQLAGFSQSIIGTALFGAINFFMTLVSANLIDRTGRKVLLLYGTYIMLVSLLLLSIVLLSPISDVIQGVIAVIGILTFVVGFAIGLGAVVWTIMSEIMPTRLRVKAVSLFLSINWGCNLLIGLLTLTAIDGLGGVKSDMDDDETSKAEKKGVAALYLIFAAFTFLCILFITFFVPETKGKSPDDLNTLSAPLLSKQDDSKDISHLSLEENSDHEN